MEMSKARVVNEPHPVLLSLLHVYDRPGSVLGTFFGIRSTRTASASTINCADVGDGFLATSVVRLVHTMSQKG
jgi:hypothetical protein